MTLLPIIVGALVFAILVVLLLAAQQPAQFRIERSARMRAPASRIFALINDLKAWSSWSPWEKKDPAMKREFSVDTVGKGAHYEWWGNKDVGHGRMEVMESMPSFRIVIKLDFISPFEAHNAAEFTFTEEGGETQVSWAMYGPNTFMGKVMCLFFNMEKMVGPDFESGLAALKVQTEQ